MNSDTHMNSSIEVGFRKAQRLAYDAVECVATEIREGWTEFQATDLVKTYLQDFGVRAFFHEPFAWFGDRTRFDGVKTYADFSPTYRRFTHDTVGLLDVAPIVNGFVGDIGYSFCKSPSKEFMQAMGELQKLRRLLPTLMNEASLASTGGSAVWKLIDEKIREDGYDNIHRIYPFSVLGHRVRRLPFAALALRSPVPFSWHAVLSILLKGIYPDLLGPSHHGSLKGLWAIEPHLGGDGFGVKFEEILVVDDKGARWLDDNVPHARQEFAVSSRRMRAG